MQKTITITLPVTATVNVNGTTIKATEYKAEKSLSVFAPAENDAVDPLKQAVEEALYLIGVEELKKDNSAADVKETLEHIKKELNNVLYSLQGAAWVCTSKVYSNNTPNGKPYLAFYRNINNAVCKADSTLWRYYHHKGYILAEYMTILAAMRAMLHFTVKELNIAPKATKESIKKAFLDYAYNKVKVYYQNGSMTTSTFTKIATDFKKMVNATPKISSFYSKKKECYYVYYNAVAVEEESDSQYRGVIERLQYMALCLPHITKFMRTLNSYKPQPLEQKINVDYNPFS